MRNVLKIIFRDFKAITTNVVALVIVMGLIVVPCLYAWFNINSNWDPYGEAATSNLVIAVYSADRGVKISDYELNVGNSIVDALRNNTTIGWIFPEDERTAINGVYSGDYYAALIVPMDFTESIASVIDGNMEGGQIIYYQNEKKNAIGAKITNKAKNAVQEQVNQTVVATITELMAKLGKVVGNNGDGIYDQLVAKIDKCKSDIEGYIDTINLMDTSLKSTETTLTGITSLNDKILKDVGADINMISTAGMAVSTSGLQSANYRLEDYILILKEGRGNLEQTRNALVGIQTSLDKMKSDLSAINNSERLSNILEVLQNNPEELGAFLSAPVDLETEAIFPIDTYGSQMASFYSVLAIWFGSLILVAIIHVKVHPFAGVSNLKSWQEFFGRYAVYYFIGQMQALICSLGNIFFIGIQCQHIFRFWFICSFSSFVFTLFIYSLTYAFGNVGEALAVIIMVIQVAGAGGTFPKECLPKVYQMVYRFLPWTYTMDAMKECIGGMYKNTYIICIRNLSVFILVSLFIGLVCSIPFRKMNHLMEESKEKTGFMI